MKLAVQGATLVLSFGVIYIWQNSPLKDYTVQLLGLFIALYLLLVARRRGKTFLKLGQEGNFGIFILNTLVFLLIFATGGLNSPLFFIIYFLAFGIAFVFDPLTVFIFIAGSILIFIPDLNTGDFTANILKVASIALVSPLAYFFGREYQKSDQQDEKVNAIEEREKEAADTISKDVEEIIEDEKGMLKEEDLEKLNEILEETGDLREESKENQEK
ncbi:MAG: hypothetical protein A2798_03600 [Candidatus Levybacteria bacterium RIFCSPHIGHO2_01_FULL_37_17]|nr:MAG: hypothetical protein A2798_03600 [Candidatus Levybacteria bacterium RIFCSPHIGHO2_01_FULL_37_17]OGH36559.1 MAG: hypothetical protein A2959_03655 [Candidatus Levybacteria bacterium RIFCSPLOWO2_01_FULL_38_23]